MDLLAHLLHPDHLHRLPPRLIWLGSCVDERDSELPQPPLRPGGLGPNSTIPLPSSPPLLPRIPIRLAAQPSEQAGGPGSGPRGAVTSEPDMVAEAAEEVLEDAEPESYSDLVKKVAVLETKLGE